MAVAGKVRCDNIIVKKNIPSLVTEDDFHRSESDIHPNSEDSWEVCDAGNGNVRRVATNFALSDDLQQFMGNDNDLLRITH
jgi:hypothetical protein